jgi:hypothetical protein
MRSSHPNSLQGCEAPGLVHDLALSSWWYKLSEPAEILDSPGLKIRSMKLHEVALKVERCPPPRRNFTTHPQAFKYPLLHSLREGGIVRGRPRRWKMLYHSSHQLSMFTLCYSHHSIILESQEDQSWNNCVGLVV